MTGAIDVGKKSPQDVKHMLSGDKPILMLYRMEMCPHCIALQPAWAAVKQRLAKEKGLVVAEVEYSNMTVLPTSLRNTRGFPSLQIIQNKKISDEYAGDRSADSIVSFALKTVPTKKVAKRPKKVRKPHASA